MAQAAGVLIVRAGRVLLSPRGDVVGWIGGSCLPGESAADCARREALEEIGCEVEILHSPVTFLEDLSSVELEPPAPLLRMHHAELFLARALGEPAAVDVPAIVWMPLERLSEVRAGTVIGLFQRVVGRYGLPPFSGH